MKKKNVMEELEDDIELFRDVTKEFKNDNIFEKIKNDIEQLENEIKPLEDEIKPIRNEYLKLSRKLIKKLEFDKAFFKVTLEKLTDEKKNNEENK